MDIFFGMTCRIRTSDVKPSSEVLSYSPEFESRVESEEFPMKEQGFTAADRNPYHDL